MQCYVSSNISLVLMVQLLFIDVSRTFFKQVKPESQSPLISHLIEAYLRLIPLNCDWSNSSQTPIRFLIAL